MTNELIVSVVLNALLAAAVLSLWRHVKGLQKELVRVREEAARPYLTFSFENEGNVLALKNVGSAPAREITIDDMPLTLKWDFPKTVTMKFQPIDVLSPSQAAPLNFTAYDGGYEMKIAPEGFLPHFKGGSYEAIVHYATWHNERWTSVLVKDGQKFSIKETRLG